MAYTRKEFVNDIGAAYPALSELECNFAYLYYLNARSQIQDGVTIGLLQHLKDEVKKLGSIFDDGKMCVGDGWKIHFNDSFILGGIHGHCDFKLVGFNKWIMPGGPDDKNSQLVPERGAKKDVVPGYSGVQLDYVADNMIPVSYGCLKVTQREIFALNEFGYRSEDAGDNRIFKCTNHVSADSASLRDYVALVGDLQTAAAAT